MKIKLLIIALFTVLFCATLQAQPADEIIRKNLINLSIPNENIKTFAFDLTISTSGRSYVSQIRYDNGNMAFNCFDADKTPLLVARNGNVLYNDALNSRVCLLRKNIVIAKVVCEDNQMQANINFHQPNDEEKENTIKVDFLALAEQALSNMRTSKENGIITIFGESAQKSIITSVIKPGDFFPLKKFSISSDDFTVSFDNIRVNDEVDKNNFIYPEKEISRSNIQLADLTEEINGLFSFGMLQQVIYSIMARSAFEDKEMQEKLEEILNLKGKLDWSKIKASDVMKSARLRNLFKAF
jgi:hypothetical protein